MIDTEEKIQQDLDTMVAFCAYIAAMIDLIDEIEAGLIDTGDGAEE